MAKMIRKGADKLSEINDTGGSVDSGRLCKGSVARNCDQAKRDDVVCAKGLI